MEIYIPFTYNNMAHNNINPLTVLTTSPFKLYGRPDGI